VSNTLHGLNLAVCLTRSEQREEDLAYEWPLGYIMRGVDARISSLEIMLDSYLSSSPCKSLYESMYEIIVVLTTQRCLAITTNDLVARHHHQPLAVQTPMFQSQKANDKP
jgi:hypothetical protein